MTNDATRTLYRIHAWTGLVFGAALFVVCLSGALAVFGEEFDLWANPAMRAPGTGAQAITLDEAAARFHTAGLLDRGRLAYLYPPHGGVTVFELFAPTCEAPRARFLLHREGGPIEQARANHVYYWLRDLHVRLFLGGGWGRPIVGLLGMVMAVSLVTGLLIHRHILRDLLLLRWGRSLRVIASDAHKLLGVGAVLFHLMIAATGAWLGLEAYLTDAAGRLARGEPGRTLFLPAPPQPDGPAAVGTPSLAAMVEEARRLVPGLTPAFLTLGGWGRAGGVVTVHGNLPGTLFQQGVNFVRFAAADGRLLQVRDIRREGFVMRLHATLEPLHYGYFGAFWVKLLWFVLGLAPALLVVTGAIVHADRTRRLRAASAATAAVP